MPGSVKRKKLMENFPAFTDYILALIFGVIIPFVSGIRSATVFEQMQDSFDSATKRRFYLSNSFFLLFIGLIIIVVWLLYDRPFSDLGFTAPQYIPWWLSGLFIALYLMDILVSVRNKDELEMTKEQMQDKTPFMPSKWKEMPAYIIMCIAAGVCEEIVYRGF